LLSSSIKPFSISTQFENQSNGAIFWITNIYGPNGDEERHAFSREIRELADTIQGPWLMAGDFNSIRNPQERSIVNMSSNEHLFNDFIWDLTLQEIPLLDRFFTWSNMQNPPILSKLDRVLLNPQWDSILPNTVMSTLPRITSDHYPLKVEISTNIPRPQIFRCCNNWNLKPGFKDLVLTLSPKGCSRILSIQAKDY
jgi:hypothetical protein